VSQLIYYFNTASGQSQWEMPEQPPSVVAPLVTDFQALKALHQAGIDKAATAAASPVGKAAKKEEKARKEAAKEAAKAAEKAREKEAKAKEKEEEERKAKAAKEAKAAKAAKAAKEEEERKAKEAKAAKAAKEEEERKAKEAKEAKAAKAAKAAKEEEEKKAKAAKEAKDKGKAVGGRGKGSAASTAGGDVQIIEHTFAAQPLGLNLIPHRLLYVDMQAQQGRVLCGCAVVSLSPLAATGVRIRVGDFLINVNQTPLVTHRQTVTTADADAFFEACKTAILTASFPKSILVARLPRPEPFSGGNFDATSVTLNEARTILALLPPTHASVLQPTAAAAETAAGGDAGPRNGGWTASVDPSSGLTFYHHPTLPSQWEQPAGWTDDAAVPALPPNWMAVVDPGSGTTYFFNSVTGASQWERPEEPAAAGAGTASPSKSDKGKKGTHSLLDKVKAKVASEPKVKSPRLNKAQKEGAGAAAPNGLYIDTADDTPASASHKPFAGAVEAPTEIISPYGRVPIISPTTQTVKDPLVKSGKIDPRKEAAEQSERDRQNVEALGRLRDWDKETVKRAASERNVRPSPFYSRLFRTSHPPLLPTAGKPKP